LIYGVNGYTGGLVAREAARPGMLPTLAGRNLEAVSALAGELVLKHRVFSLDEPASLARGIEGHHDDALEAEIRLKRSGDESRTSRSYYSTRVRQSK
jgi:uncharacterized protein YbjT (DUF2867 family)